MCSLYFRVNSRTFFLLPTMAVGVDVNGLWFVEVAWFCFAAGLGDV